jgi:hypothetical protein
MTDRSGTQHGADNAPFDNLKTGVLNIIVSLRVLFQCLHVRTLLMGNWGTEPFHGA